MDQHMVRIDEMNPADWMQVREIFQEGIASGHATFATEAPAWEEWDYEHVKNCRLVAWEKEVILGWAALKPVSSRKALEGTAESSIYIRRNQSGQGIGTKLLQALIASSEEHGFWSLVSYVFQENTGSLYLHKKCGFREVGVRHGIGKLNGIWRDIVILERRSSVVGMD